MAVDLAWRQRSLVRHRVGIPGNFRDDDVEQADVAFDRTEPSLEELVDAYRPGGYRFFGIDVEGNSLFDLPGDATEFVVPDGFFEAGTEYVLDVITIAENGNLTVNDALFTTAE